MSFTRGGESIRNFKPGQESARAASRDRRELEEAEQEWSSGVEQRRFMEREGFGIDRQPTLAEIARAEAMLALLEELLFARIGQPRVESPFHEDFYEGQKPYEFFDTDGERRELFQYCAAVAEYVRDNNVADLVIVDRSSRPLYVGVREYWRAKYPEERMPGIYFMNPKGFKAREDLSDAEIADMALDAQWKGDVCEGRDQIRSEDEIFEEFQTTYAALLRDKDRPVLVFDSCLHTGNTLAPLVEKMRALGFSDLRVGSVNPSDPGSKVPTDFHITRRRPEKGCYPFDRDRSINKVFSQTAAKRNEDPVARARGRRLRREIGRVVREELDAATPTLQPEKSTTERSFDQTWDRWNDYFDQSPVDPV